MPGLSQITKLLAGLALMVTLGVGGGNWATGLTSKEERSDKPQEYVKPRNSVLSADSEPMKEGSPLSPSEVDVAEEPLSSAQAIANALIQGDLLLTSGNAAEALRYYQRINEDEHEVETVGVPYRLALCAEALGDDMDALVGYQTAAKNGDDGQLKELALLGQARVLIRRGEIIPAQRILRRWILSQSMTLHSSPTVASEALYLLGDMTTMIALQNRTVELWEPEAVCLPHRTFNPGRYLPDIQTSELEPSAVRPPGLTIVHQLSVPTPDSVTLSGHFARAKIGRVIEDLAHQTGWRADLSPQAADVIRTALINLDFEEQPANLMLDWMLTPQGLVWRFEDGVLWIKTDDELPAEQLQEYDNRQAERALLAALLHDPEHIETPAAYLLLGNLAFEQKQLQTARRHYEHILQTFPRSTVQAEAWFNLAKVALVEQDLTNAEQALEGAMDASRGQPLESVALFLTGQTLLSLDRPHDAARPLMRCVSLASETHLRAMSLLALATSHLLNGQPDRANVALMEDRSLLDSAAYRSRTAFLASLARFRAASTPSRRKRDGQSLIESLSDRSDETDTGLPNVLLRAQAYDEVGLRYLAITTIENAVGEAPPSKLRERVLLILVDWLIQHGELQRAESHLQELVERSTNATSKTARLQLAQVYIHQGRVEESRETCFQLLAEEIDRQDRSDVLLLLGQLYATQGDHKRAILCYTGVVPQRADKGK